MRTSDRLPLVRQAGTAARWPIGVAFTTWRYLWRVTPIWRHEHEGTLPDDGPPELPADFERHDLQPPESGYGALFHRRYRIRIEDGELSPEELVARVAGDPAAVSPTEFATFQKIRGDEGEMAPGDEYIVRMAAPWDGPVRVVHKLPDRFRLATLTGHLEAGQIEFRARGEDDAVVFEIESWARSKNRLADLLYAHLRMSKEIQLHMWTSTLEKIARLAGARAGQGIEIETRRVPADAFAAQR